LSGKRAVPMSSVQVTTAPSPGPANRQFSPAPLHVRTMASAGSAPELSLHSWLNEWWGKFYARMMWGLSRSAAVIRCCGLRSAERRSCKDGRGTSLRKRGGSRLARWRVLLCQWAIYQQLGRACQMWRANCRGSQTEREPRRVSFILRQTLKRRRPC
jgi:hypothetical protein